MARRVCSLICLGGAVALLGAGGAYAASGAPSGDAQAVAFANSVQAAYTHVAAVSYTEQGYAGLSSAIGRSSFFQVNWGTGYQPAGWVSANEHAVVALHRGLIVWAKDDLTPPSCSSAIGCSTVPVELVETRAGSYWRFDEPGARFACFNRIRGPVLPITIGDPLIGVGGLYGPLVASATTVTTHFAYAFPGNRNASETDTVSASTKLISSRRVSVSKGTGRKQPAFTFSAALKNLASAPAQPKPSICS